MEVNGVAFKQSNDGSTNASAASLADNFDTFLSLLTTQLKNQDPLEPMDSNQFTQQLVQFAGVEQAINTNKKLDQLIGMQAGGGLNNAVAYIGKTVEASGDQIVLQDGGATLGYDLAANAAQARISIVDALGRTVRVLDGERASGSHRLTWDGLDQNGVQLPDGTYRFAVAAVDANGKTVDSTTFTSGRVTGVETRDGGLTVMLGNRAVPFGSIRAVHESESQDSGPA